MGDKRAALTAVLAVGGALLVAVLGVWAASIGPSGVLTGDGPAVHRLTPTETPSTPSDPFATMRTDDRDRLQEQHAGDHPVLRAIALVLEVVAALGVLLLLFLGGRRAWREYRARHRPPADPVAVDFDVLGEPARVADRMEHDAAHQRALLLDGEPRNGIVACWHRFEVQAAEAGLARRPWETSAEFTLRMLDLVAADSHAVAELAALYREARFSEHDLDESARATAVAALAAVHRGLQRSRS